MKVYTFSTVQGVTVMAKGRLTIDEDEYIVSGEGGSTHVPRSIVVYYTTEGEAPSLVLSAEDKRRKAEIARANKARSLAMQRLRSLHESEYEALYRKALGEVGGL